jgi:hypothetical protein
MSLAAAVDTDNRETLAPPRVVHLLTDGDTTVHLFWYDNNSRLLGIRNTPWAIQPYWPGRRGVWKSRQTATACTWPLRPTDSACPGRRVSGDDGHRLGRPCHLEISYFRGLQAIPRISVAGDQADHALVTWDDPRLGSAFV